MQSDGNLSCALWDRATMLYEGENSVLILGLGAANERRRYKVTPSLIGWAQS